MTRRIWIAALLAASFAAGAANAQDSLVTKELIPTGKLRVAIAVSPSPSALFAIKGPASGKLRGVTIDLGTGLARKLGVPVEFVEYAASGEIIRAADAGVWDVTFMPVDEERKKFVNFGNAYHLLQSTYLVAPNSTIKTIADANAGSVRIVGVRDTATFRASNAASPNATHIAVAGPADAIAMMLAGKADAIALGRESLGGISAKIPGSRILDGGILNSTTAIAVPKGKPAALAYVSVFIEEAKASGLVRRAFDDVGLKNSQIAPPGMKP